MAERTWTRQEATRSLVLVRKIVFDLVQAQNRFVLSAERMSRYATAGSIGYGNLGKKFLTEERAATKAARQDREGYIKELKAMGVILQCARNGVVAFDSDHEGVAIRLIWRTGDDVVDHWVPLGTVWINRRKFK